jgi:two-component system response regulator CpxR
VLLVDDEREFVQTLSERLQLRDMGSAVAYDGESALALVAEDEPEVMIIDLKMPGIDGMEILKQVKATRPEIEVIVLTGHGSEADRKQCMQLGAFAYMQKPVDIDELSDTLKKAHEKSGQFMPKRRCRRIAAPADGIAMVNLSRFKPRFWDHRDAAAGPGNPTSASGANG